MRPTISVTVDLKGFDKVEPKVRGAIKTGLKKVGFNIERDAKIFSPIDTGRLRASIFTTQKGWKMVMVQDNVQYGIYQELGTRFMAPHPFMKPALNKNISRIPSIITNEIRRALR